MHKLQFERLREIPIKGNFTIKSHTFDVYKFVMSFFYNRGAKQALYFKELNHLPSFQKEIEEYKQECEKSNQFFIIESFSPVWTVKDKWKFIIRYESLNELLKLREIFNVRGNGFDTRLIEKRGYNPFTPDFFAKITEPIKVIKK